MADVLDHVHRCDRAFGADQQESRHRKSFDFTHGLYEFELQTLDKVTFAMGDFYAHCVATWDDHANRWNVEICGWFTDEALTSSLTRAAERCTLSREVVKRLNSLDLADDLETRADEIERDSGPW